MAIIMLLSDEIVVCRQKNVIPEHQISYKYHHWDLSFWRFSDKGFFKLKKQIKKIVGPLWDGPLFSGV